jgi:hypothetical protein
MRFLTRGLANGECDDDNPMDAYEAHLREIEPRLSASILRLARGVNLHDAVLEEAEWSPATRELALRFIAGTVETGYRTVALKYRGAMLGDRRLETLRNVARDREACVLYDEVDVDDDGAFAHRYLFWPREEVTIDFVELELEITERVDSRVHLGSAFVENVEDD